MARALLVNLQGKIGGAERSLILMARYLRSQFAITVACPGESPLSKELASLEIETCELPESPDFSYLSLRFMRYWLRTSWRLTRMALKMGPDIIHANSFYAGTVSVLAGLVTGARLLLHARDLRVCGPVWRFYGWFCVRIIAVSNTVKNVLTKQGIKPEKVRVVYNGVDTVAIRQDDENGDSLRGSVRNEKHNFIFAQVGQLVPWKNHLLFLRAGSEVVDALPNARFVLVGDDIFGRDCSYRIMLHRLIENSRISDRITLLGWREDMHEVWCRINCLVHTANHEPFGRVIVEAMAHRVPVIAVDAGGPGEIIQNDKTGILVQADDVKGLSEAMLKVAQDAELAEKLASEGCRCVASTFSGERTAAGVRQVYEEVLAL